MTTTPKPKTRLDAYYDSIVEMQATRLLHDMSPEERQQELAKFRERLENDAYPPAEIKRRWALETVEE